MLSLRSELLSVLLNALPNQLKNQNALTQSQTRHISRLI